MCREASEHELDTIGSEYAPSLLQAAAKAAKRHTTNTRSALDFMVGGVARKVALLVEPQVMGTLQLVRPGVE